MRTRFRHAVVLGCLVVSCGEAAGPVGQIASGWQPALRLSTSGRAASLSYNFAWSIAADESDRVHAVWYDRDSSIHYTRSTDGGASWSAPAVLSNSTMRASDPAIALDGEKVYVVWHQFTGTEFDVVLRRSVNAGLTWLTEARLSSSGKSAHSSIAASRGHVHVVWGDVSTGKAEIHTRVSHTGGETWFFEERVSETPYESWVPTVAASGDTVLVGWVDYRDANEEEYVRRSVDGGLTWTSMQRLTSDAADSWAPSLAIVGKSAHIAWFDRRDVGITDTQLETSLDSIAEMMGLSVEPAPPRSADQYYLQPFIARIQLKMTNIKDAAPSWVAKGGDPQLLEAKLKSFEQRFETWAMGWEVYYKRSSDAGLTWSADTRITHAPGLSARPSMAVRRDTIHIVWFDSRIEKSNTDIYYKQSLDGGVTWTMDDALTSTPGTSAHASVAAASGRVHVIWFDEKSGHAEIWYRRRTP